MKHSPLTQFSLVYWLQLCFFLKELLGFEVNFVSMKQMSRKTTRLRDIRRISPVQSTSTPSNAPVVGPQLQSNVSWFLNFCVTLLF